MTISEWDNKFQDSNLIRQADRKQVEHIDRRYSAVLKDEDLPGLGDAISKCDRWKKWMPGAFRRFIGVMLAMVGTITLVELLWCNRTTLPTWEWNEDVKE